MAAGGGRCTLAAETAVTVRTQLKRWSGFCCLCTAAGPRMQCTPHHDLKDEGLVGVGVGEDLLVVCTWQRRRATP